MAASKRPRAGRSASDAGSEEVAAEPKKAPRKRAKSGSTAPAAVAKPAHTGPSHQARAIMRGARQSPYKMRLVIDEIRGKSVNDALAYLAFSKKHAAKQIEKTLRSAVANVEQAARQANDSLDVDDLVITLAIVNEARPLKRFTPAAQGRATPVRKRTSHVEIVVAERGGR
jgi:large subunit ribosomal protein L22